MAKPDTKIPKLESKKGASVKLEGKTAEDFKTVKDRIETATPGLWPRNSDVLRYALHLAASKQRKAQNE